MKPERRNPGLIALTGLSGSGKDTVATHLEHHDYARIALADRLKHAVAFVFGLSERQLWGDGRDAVVPALGITPRELYQRFSDACRELDPEVWTRSFERELADRAGTRSVWTDLRTRDELDLARRLGARVVRVVRPGAGAPGSAARHSTETELADLPDSAFDVILANDGTLEQLARRIDRDVLGRLLPRSVNLHFWRPCDMRCGFCFATYLDTKTELPKGHLTKEELLELIELVARGGAEKLTFVGGEPTLCPWLGELIAHARAQGLTTMVVSNGWNLRKPGYIENELGDLDWLSLSVDSLDPERNRRSGRARGQQTMSERDLLAIVDRARAMGMRLKLNTVVHAHNYDENLTEFALRMRPNRWKLFQVLPVVGQNDERFAEFEIGRDQFEAYVDRHRGLEDHGILVVPETNEAMRGSYAMIDPLGRFFDNVDGRHRYSEPIAAVGVQQAWEQIRFDPERFMQRGGNYDFDVPIEALGRARDPSSSSERE
jgi:radical S-adenosyl methionine domain-containing protein 2